MAFSRPASIQCFLHLRNLKATSRFAFYIGNWVFATEGSPSRRDKLGGGPAFRRKVVFHPLDIIFGSSYQPDTDNMKEKRIHSTVTLLARFFGLSMEHPLSSAA